MALKRFIVFCLAVIAATVAARAETEVFNAAVHRGATRRTFQALDAPTSALCLAHLRNASNNYADPCQHGRCVDNSCRCDDDATKGHWVGTLCTECGRGWAGPLCAIECAGGNCNRCSSHGTCYEGLQGDGQCTCYATRSTGFWGGSNCSRCAENYFGATCEQACPGIELTGAACFGRGSCVTTLAGDGICICNAGYGAASGCFDCDASHYGPACALTCIGTITVLDVQLPCNGHGYCNNGTAGLGTCTCDPMWGTRDCSVRCPDGNCNFGFCLDGATNPAMCVCEENFAQPDCATCVANMTGSHCTLPCKPTNGDPVCYGNGVCTYRTSGDLQFSWCECAPGYYGESCLNACPGNPPCGGHGNCTSDGQCECNTGYTGATCSDCDAAFAGSACTIACPLSASGKVCNDLGLCYNGVCFCSFTSTGGSDFCGPACERPTTVSGSVSCGNATRRRACPSGRWGGVCDKFCAGTSTATGVCTGHGYCDDGMDGTGKCTCFAGYATSTCAVLCPSSELGICSGLGRGYCTTNDITVSNPNGRAACVCAAAYGGASCNVSCPVIAGNVCAGHGVCDRDFTGTCQCSAQWTGVACDVPCGCDLRHGSCNATLCARLNSWETCYSCNCASGFDGRCDSCIPGRQGAACQGECVHGKTVGQLCECDAYWSGTACDDPCKTFNGSICGGHGRCLYGTIPASVCVCYPEGNPIYFGSACQVKCTVEQCMSSAVSPLVHPQCNSVTGACECQNDFSGHWYGPSCAECNPRYWGPTCSEECQCNDHGICDQNTGECVCYDSEINGHYAGTFCDACAAGFIGQRCDRRNVAITRVNRFRDAVELLQPRSASNTVTPNVLATDDTGTMLYAGGIPVYRYALSGMAMDVTQSTSATVSCPDEIFRVYIGSLYVYYAVQSDPSCGRRPRIVRVPVGADATNGTRLDLNAFESKDAAALNFFADPTRVRFTAMDNIDVSGFPVLFYVLAPFDGERYLGGELLGMIDVSSFFTSSSTRVELLLESTFITRDLAAEEIAATGSDQENSQQIVLGGERLGAWSALYYRKSVTGTQFENALPSATSPYLEDAVNCWPWADGKGDTTSYTTCPGCIAVDRVEFYGSTIVAAIFTNQSGAAQTVFARFRTLTSLGNNESLWVRFGSPPTTCSRARYFPQSAQSIVPQGMAPGSPNIPSEVEIPEVVVDTTPNDDAGTRATAIAVDAQGATAYFGMAGDSSTVPSKLAKVSLTTSEFVLSGSKLLSFVVQGGTSNLTVPERITELVVAPAARLLFAPRWQYQLRAYRDLHYVRGAQREPDARRPPSRRAHHRLGASASRGRRQWPTRTSTCGVAWAAAIRRARRTSPSTPSNAWRPTLRTAHPTSRARANAWRCRSTAQIARGSRTTT
jgi:hypothetical protein